MSSSNIGSAVTPEDLLAHSAWLQRLACRLVDPSTAEDLVQETWATAVRTRPERDRPLRPWLAEVLRNLARMRARSAGRWRARAPRLSAGDEGALPSPEELLTFHEAQRLVAEAVAKLEEPYRSTVLLCYAQEIEPSEIARRQGIPGGTVRWRLKHGLDQVRADLDARYGQDRQRWRLVLAPLAARAAGGAPAGAAATGAVTTGVGAAGAAAVTGTRLPALAGGWKLAGVAVTAAAIGAGALWWGGRDTPDAPVASERAAVAPLVRGSRPSVPRLALAPAATPAGTPAAAAASPPPPAGVPGLVGAAPARAEPAVDRAEAVRKAIEPGDSPARGNPKAPITIVSYSEFQCPFCARVVPTLRELEKAYPDQIRLVWKHLPLAFHESAPLAAEAALAAGEQGKFWEMHDRLFAAQDRLDLPTLEEHARALALDVPRFRAALDGAKFKARVDADLKLAKDADISGTPTFFINGERLAGAQPLSAFVHQVETALAKLKGLPPPAPPAPARPVNDFKRTPMFFGPWPPVAITLPDNVLGDRVPVRFATGNAPVRGNPRGPVEVLYFTNLNAFEGRAIAKGLLSTHAGHVKLVAKVVPTIYGPPPPMGPKEPELLGAVAHYAHSQGKFWEFHDALAPGGRPPEREQIEQIAQSVGLDLTDLRAALEEKRFQPAIEQDREAIRAAKLEGPFAFVVNGRQADSPVALAQLVDAAIRRAGRKPPARPPATPGMVINPGDPAYEPQKLMNQMSMRQLFGYEPRDSAWASAVEKQLGPMIDRDLRGIEPALASTTLECRSRLCRLRWNPGKGNDMAIAMGARTLYSSFGRITKGEMYMALRSGTVRTLEDSISRIKSRRSTVLYNYKTGRATGNLHFPIERLPKE